MSARHTLTLAHSADADDVFMWWPITGMVDPADPSIVLRSPAMDTGRFIFRSVPEDISVLNARAMEIGDLDITAISMATYPSVADRYQLTVCGSSFGDDWGPKLVRRADRTELRLESIAASGGARLRIAVPGLRTTAYLALSALLPTRSFEAVPMRFDRIIRAVETGEADLGLLIHEAQLTFQHAGLVALGDMGVWWKSKTGLPLPLGGNAVRRDLDDRFGPASRGEVVRLLSRSIEFALTHRAESLDYARTFSPLKGDVELERYIDLYVNRLTVDARPDGLRSLELLFAEGAALGLLPAIGAIDMLAP